MNRHCKKIFLSTLAVGVSFLVSCVAFVALYKLGFSQIFCGFSSIFFGGLTFKSQEKIVLEKGDKKTLRGRKRISEAEARAEAKAKLKEGDSVISWGGVPISSKEAQKHFLYIGQSGSGKTTLLKDLMRQALKNIGQGIDQRALVYDAKGEVVSFLHSLQIPQNCIKILNPLDARCVGWDIARDITKPSLARTLASIIIPQQHGDNRFFSDAARQLVSGVLESFIYTNIERKKRGEKALHWTLRDACLALRDRDELQKVLEKHKNTEKVLEHLERENNEVFTSVISYFNDLEIIAAAWHSPNKDGTKRELISLTEWRDNKEGWILVLGRDPEARFSIDLLNRIIFERITQVILKGEEVEGTSKRTWFFLDEFSKIGRLTGFDDLLTNGRSKGACIAIGFQTPSGVRHHYKELTDEILGECKLKMFLKSDGSTAKWNEDFIGRREVLRETDSSGRSTNVNLQRTSTTRQDSTSETYAEEPVVHYSEFSEMPDADFTNGVYSFCLAPQVDGVWQFHFDGKNDCKVIASLRSHEPNYLEREDAEYEVLTDWTPEERKELELTSKKTRSLSLPRFADNERAL